MYRHLFLLLLPFSLVAGPKSALESGRREVLRACTSCHTLAVIAAQQLSREEWSVELRKMMKMGAKVRNREAVLDFLTSQYGEPKPTTPDDLRPQ